MNNINHSVINQGINKLADK